MCCLCFCPTRYVSFLWIRHYFGEGLLLLTSPRHSWPEGSEGSYLACCTYYNIGRLFVMCLFRGSVTIKSFAERLIVKLSIPVFDALGLSRLKFKHSASRMWNRCCCHETQMKKKYTVQGFEKTLVVIMTHISNVSILIKY